jgi:DNA-directed RNA polymerase subunit beta
MSLSFRDHRFEEMKYSIDECKERDQTYSAPLFVTAEFMNNRPVRSRARRSSWATSRS